MVKKYDYNMNILDIGGGFLPLDNDTIKFDTLANLINNTIQNEFINNNYNINVIAEPGRFLVGTAITIYSTIIGKKIKNDKHIYYIDNGVYGLFNCQMFDYQYPLFDFYKINNNNDNNNNSYDSIIFGPTCDSLDLVRENIKLPNLNINDKLIFNNVGAYTIVSSTFFNGLNNYDIYYHDD